MVTGRGGPLESADSRCGEPPLRWRKRPASRVKLLNRGSRLPLRRFKTPALRAGAALRVPVPVFVAWCTAHYNHTLFLAHQDRGPIW